MNIVKRNGSIESFQLHKVVSRIARESDGLNLLSAGLIAEKVVPYIMDGMTTKEVDELIANRCADLILNNPDYGLLGGRILMTRQSKILDRRMKSVDRTYDFFAANTFLDRYAMKSADGQPLELPSMMYKRVADHLYSDDELEDKNELLTELYEKRINFATPTYTNAGIEGRNGMISCQIVHLKEDSKEGITETLNKISFGSASGSGIGLCIDNLRSKDTLVSSFKGTAGGVVRLADMVQASMRFFKQGDRAGSCALYLSTWHRDIMDYLEISLPIGEEKLRMRDLFTAVTVDDVFMNCLLSGKDYYTFCPHQIKLAGLPALHDVAREEFGLVYNQAVALGLGKAISPKKIWDAIITAQVESGRPYVFYKDNANKRNMQDNIGIVKQSQLCIEIMTASKPGYSPQCTLGSINLANQTGTESIAKSTRVLVKALNKVIDKNKWSDEWAELAGLDQRNLAIGVAGMADMFAQMNISFEGDEAKNVTEEIFKTMYTAAVSQSSDLAISDGSSYPAWKGSRYSKGETYIEGWNPIGEGKSIPMRNSLLLGLMPTASSANLLGVFESFQPVDSNMFTRSVSDGEYVIINKYLVKELTELGIWTEELKEKIIEMDGSVQGIEEIPADIQHRYKTVWEIPQKALLDLAVIRNKFVDQSQSMNVYHKDGDYNKISSALMYAWKKGLKTGVYYTRTKSKLESNKKLSSSTVKEAVKPADSEFSCAGGGCDA
jgi:ribonucleoside-diphosphate reductase alpha chain